MTLNFIIFLTPTTTTTQLVALIFQQSIGSFNLIRQTIRKSTFIVWEEQLVAKEAPVMHCSSFDQKKLASFAS